MLINTIPETLYLTKGERQILAALTRGESSGSIPEAAQAIGCSPQNVYESINRAKRRNRIRSNRYLLLQFKLADAGYRTIYTVWRGWTG